MLERAKKPERRAELEAELFPPPPPAPLSYLLEHFFRLRRRKASAGFGVPPFEWPDLDAYCRNAGVAFQPWEVLVLEELDDLYVAEKNTKRPDEGKDS